MTKQDEELLRSLRAKVDTLSFEVKGLKYMTIKLARVQQEIEDVKNAISMLLKEKW